MIPSGVWALLGAVAETLEVACRDAAEFCAGKRADARARERLRGEPLDGWPTRMYPVRPW